MGFRAKVSDEIQEMPEIDKVAVMRMNRLMEAGYTSDQADRLAQCTHVDLHKAEELGRRVVARGLDAQVAFEILY